MTHTPETRLSLLVRLRDRGDQAAWHEFVAIYRPVIYRLACRRGLQHADAEDLVQQVLLAIARAIDRWQPESCDARFRTWLHRIAQNLIINALTRGARERGSGSANNQQLLNNTAQQDPDTLWLQLESRREMFRWAAAQIQTEFHPNTWNAFWWTAVQQRDANEVAGQLQKSCGAIYAARSRVMKRLKEKVQEIVGQSDYEL